jgi:hypothetical protein
MCLKGLNLIAQGSFFNRMVPKCFNPDNKCCGCRNRMKIEKKNIVRQISAFKASVIKKLDELEKSALLEIETASQDSISQMEREESELEKHGKAEMFLRYQMQFQVA